MSHDKGNVMKSTDIAPCCNLPYRECHCAYLRQLCCGSPLGIGHFEDCDPAKMKVLSLNKKYKITIEEVVEDE